jgi:hypothetical protein
MQQAGTHERHHLVWRLCVIAAIALSALAFSPFILAPGVAEPSLAGVPWTLWTSILIAFALIVVTAVGAWTHPARDDDE